MTYSVLKTFLHGFNVPESVQLGWDRRGEGPGLALLYFHRLGEVVNVDHKHPLVVQVLSLAGKDDLKRMCKHICFKNVSR